VNIIQEILKDHKRLRRSNGQHRYLADKHSNLAHKDNVTNEQYKKHIIIAEYHDKISPLQWGNGRIYTKSQKKELFNKVKNRYRITGRKE
jgi:hypothetical protein